MAIFHNIRYPQNPRRSSWACQAKGTSLGGDGPLAAHSGLDNLRRHRGSCANRRDRLREA